MSRWLIFCLLFAAPMAQAQIEFNNILDEMLFNYELRQHYLNGGKKEKKKKKKDAKENPAVRCNEIYLTMKDMYEQKIKLGAPKLMHEGNVTTPFTRNEIENMGDQLKHGIKTKIRGTDKVLKPGYSYSGVPYFPHTRPGCENAYQEEVKIINLGNKKCRQVKFTQENYPEVVYHQVYCENSDKLLISFDPEEAFDADEVFPPTDCVHCQQ